MTTNIHNVNSSSEVTDFGISLTTHTDQVAWRYVNAKNSDSRISKIFKFVCTRALALQPAWRGVLITTLGVVMIPVVAAATLPLTAKIFSVAALVIGVSHGTKKIRAVMQSYSSSLEVYSQQKAVIEVLGGQKEFEKLPMITITLPDRITSKDMKGQPITRGICSGNLPCVVFCVQKKTEPSQSIPFVFYQRCQDATVWSATTDRNLNVDPCQRPFAINATFDENVNTIRLLVNNQHPEYQLVKPQASTEKA